MVVSGCGSIPVYEEPVAAPPPPVLPTFEILQPERGTFQETPGLIIGQAFDGDAAVSAVSVNGVDVPFNGEGYFEGNVPDVRGIALIGTRVQDENGERAVDGRSVHVGPVNPAGTVINDAVGVHLSYELLDDDSPDLDDMAGLGEAVVTDPSFGSFIAGTPIQQGPAELTIRDLTIDDADIDIQPDDGFIQFDVELLDVDATFDFSAYDYSDTGHATMEAVVLEMDLALSMGETGIVAEVTYVQADVEGFEWEFQSLPTWISSSLKDSAELMMEQEMERQAVELTEGGLASTLELFALDTSIGEKEEVRIRMNLSSLDVSSRGISMWMDGSIKANSVIGTPPAGAGSLHTSETVLPDLPVSGRGPFTAVVDDDLLNQTLFALWQSGIISQFSFSGTELALLTGAPLVAPLGPADNVTMTMGLPPVIRPSDGDYTMDFSLGELLMDIEREDGERITTSINVTVAGELDSRDAGIGLLLDSRPAYTTVHTGMLATPEGLDPGDLASLFRLSTPTLIGNAAKFFPSFPLPEIPLGEFVPVTSLEGKVWGAADLDHTFDDDGTLILSGAIVPMDAR